MNEQHIISVVDKPDLPIILCSVCNCGNDENSDKPIISYYRSTATNNNYIHIVRNQRLIIYFLTKNFLLFNILIHLLCTGVSNWIIDIVNLPNFDTK